MPVIREPDGIDLYVESSPITPEEALQIADLIKSERKDLRQRAATRRAVDTIQSKKTDSKQIAQIKS